MKNVLFVCIANICRSPALMAFFNHMAAIKKLDAHADSCGIGWVHLGERPNARIFEAAKKRGVFIDHRTQQFQDEFLDIYDLILVVDEDVAEQLKMKRPKDRDKIRLATDFSQKFKGQPIPDPYYMSHDGFDKVLDMIEDCCSGLMDYLQSYTNPSPE